MERSRGEIVIYETRDKKIQIDVRVENETVWLTQKEIAVLFHVDRTVIGKHIRNIIVARELDAISVCAKFAHTARDGKVYRVSFYSLDAIISVGYRVNSTRATQFRIWATQILKKHLIEGYTLNEKKFRKTEAKYLELQKAVSIIGNVLQFECLPLEARGIAEVISGYARALDILDDFDHKRLAVPVGTKAAKYTITYENAKEIIDTLKIKFSSSKLVGLEKDQSFKSSLGAIYQSAGGKDVYPTIEEKAANLLYFVTKNHSFVDGNKRIAAALFVCYLGENGLLYDKDGRRKVDTNALIALTIMTAASNPAEKDIMIRVILNLLAY